MVIIETKIAVADGELDENIDWALGDADGHEADLSTIELEVSRVKVKRLPTEPTRRAVVTTPRKALDLSGSDLDNMNFTNALWRKQRSAPPVLDSRGFTRGTDEKKEHARLSFLYRYGLAHQLQVLRYVLRVPAKTPKAIAANPGQYTYTSKDFRMLADKVDRLEEQLKESQKHVQARYLRQHSIQG
ncbi:MAG: hypothetical protein Q9169_006691 [Polycauliona sp. 2 TL-2023]